MRSCSSRAPFLFLSTLSSRPPPLDLCLSATSLSFPPLSSPAPLCYCLSLFSLSLSFFLPSPPLSSSPFSRNFSSLCAYYPIHLSVYLSICLSLEAPRAARATCTAAKLKNDAGSRRIPSELTCAPMQGGLPISRRHRLRRRSLFRPLLLPLSPSLSLFLSLSLCLSISLSSSPGVNAGGGWRRRAVAEDTLSLSLSRNLRQRSLAVVEDRQNVRRT